MRKPARPPKVMTSHIRTPCLLSARRDHLQPPDGDTELAGLVSLPLLLGPSCLPLLHSVLLLLLPIDFLLLRPPPLLLPLLPQNCVPGGPSSSPALPRRLPHDLCCCLREPSVWCILLLGIITFSGLSCLLFPSAKPLSHSLSLFVVLFHLPASGVSVCLAVLLGEQAFIFAALISCLVGGMKGVCAGAVRLEGRNSCANWDVS